MSDKLRYRAMFQRIGGQSNIASFHSTGMDAAISAAIGMAGGRELKDMKVLEIHEFHESGMVKMLNAVTGQLIEDPGQGKPAKDAPSDIDIASKKKSEALVQELIDKAEADYVARSGTTSKPISKETLHQIEDRLKNVAPITQHRLRSYRLCILPTVEKQVVRKGFGGRDG